MCLSSFPAPWFKVLFCFCFAFVSFGSNKAVLSSSPTLSCLPATQPTMPVSGSCSSECLFLNGMKKMPSECKPIGPRCRTLWNQRVLFTHEAWSWSSRYVLETSIYILSQSDAGKVIFDQNMSFSVQMCILASLHWFSFKSRITFKIIVVTWRSE